MIVTNAKDIWRYKGISEPMKKAIEFIESGEYKNTPQDKTRRPVVEGEVEVIRMGYEPKPEPGWEAHEGWIDIQIILEGEEKMLYAPLYRMTKEGEYDAKKDLQKLSGNATVEIIAKAGDFIIFFPEDGHAPNVASDNLTTVDKVVVKVKN